MIICIISFLLIIAISVSISTIKLEIVSFDIDNINKYEKKVNNYEVNLGIYAFNKIKWLGIKTNREKREKLKGTKKEKIFKKILNTKSLKKLLKPSIKNIINVFVKSKQVDLNVEKFKLTLKFGTKNVLLTTSLFSVLSIIIPCFLERTIKNYQEEVYKYKITPIFKNESFYDLTLNCIISVKIAHIISIFYKQKRSEKVNARTSNRVINGNSHEQYSRVG